MGRFSIAGIIFVIVAGILSIRLMYNQPKDGVSADAQASHGKFRYSIVPRVFAPSESDSNPDNYDFIHSNLGLIEGEYASLANKDSETTQWSYLEANVQKLNAQSDVNTRYKVLFLGRHGEGWHNVAETKYGTKAWDSHWSLLEGDDTMHWADAHLTPTGEQQALAAHAFFEKQLKMGLPAPEAYYSSPLTRCLQTCNFTYNGLTVPMERPFRPVTVKELFRETNGEHTCDRRSSLSQLRANLPDSLMSNFAFEPGFSDEDRLWSPTERETDAETQQRLRLALDDVFEHDNRSWISITSHSGAIKAMLVVLNHRPFPLRQGSMLAVFVKAEVLGH